MLMSIYLDNVPLEVRGISCGVVVNVMECDIAVSEFEPQSPYYFHFWTNTPGKRHEPPSCLLSKKPSHWKCENLGMIGLEEIKH